MASWQHIDIIVDGQPIKTLAPIIVSASRSTDIPAFYADWFFDRLEKGFSAFAIKDSLSDVTGGFGGVMSLMTYARLALEFIILFFIAYAVIRLIMRSRNSYYATLRILGATKGNTDTILRVELILMMLIAYSADLAFALLIKRGVLQDLVRNDLKEVVKMLHYLTPLDYGVLGAALLIMSLLIANRYSRHIFTKSAMKAFREGA